MTMEDQGSTLEDLKRWADMKDEEAGVYLSLLVPLLQRLGGEALITLQEAMAVPEGVTIGMDRVNANDVRVWLEFPENGPNEQGEGS